MRAAAVGAIVICIMMTKDRPVNGCIKKMFLLLKNQRKISE